MLKTEDGGYYALKGFQFQYIRALKSLLDFSKPDDSLILENIEDFETVNQLIQVKYKETKKYSKSLIKEAVIKLLKESKGNELELILHTYFNDYENFEKETGVTVENNEKYKITIDYLEEILSGNSSEFTLTEKESFINRFSICFTSTFHLEVEQIINNIKDQFNIENTSAAFIQFNQFIAHLNKIVVEHPKEEAYNRICYRHELDDIHENTNNVIVNEYLEIMVGKTKYFTIIKEKFKFRDSPVNCEKIFCLNLQGSLSAYCNFIINIKNRFYKRSTFKKRERIDSPAPYIYINESQENILQIKNFLYDNDVLFLDGYPYYGSQFRSEHITQNTEVQSEFEVKIITEREEIQRIQNHYSNKKIFYYNFYDDSNDVLDLEDDFAEVYNIKVDSVEDINTYLF